MSFSYDVTTTIGKMRMLIGDTVSNPASTPPLPDFQDEELQAILNVVSGMESGWATVACSAIPQNELLLLACAQAVEVLASRYASSKQGQTYVQGDYKLTGKDQIAAMMSVAQRFRDAVNNTPAWGIIEENTCGFNEMVIIRNWVLRTEM
jgi:hypothetical protein